MGGSHSPLQLDGLNINFMNLLILMNYCSCLELHGLLSLGTGYALDCTGFADFLPLSESVNCKVWTVNPLK